jgi:hypothetical protein
MKKRSQHAQVRDAKRGSTCRFSASPAS